MTLNRHGHHIPATPTDDEPKYHEVVLCSGSPYCNSCALDAGVPVNFYDPAVV